MKTKKINPSNSLTIFVVKCFLPLLLLLLRVFYAADECSIALLWKKGRGSLPATTAFPHGSNIKSGHFWAIEIRETEAAKHFTNCQSSPFIPFWIPPNSESLSFLFVSSQFHSISSHGPSLFTISAFQFSIHSPAPQTGHIIQPSIHISICAIIHFLCGAFLMHFWKYKNEKQNDKQTTSLWAQFSSARIALISAR